MAVSYAYKNTDSSALVKTGPGFIHSVTLIAAANNTTLILYDNTEGSGTVIWKLDAEANASHSAILDVTFSKGLYAALTGAGGSVSVSYR